ncbi:DUF4268 domain-containing protein [Lutibacter sp. TH_r2]|uniref:DUF4268 domain-containing protein n=1 Tax=Lutibacter sp. TH_r2 TaxID=3082083 RepID=UPI0029545DA9|nr:DUF4268 domain-containing protein [Lutibacter sp. TH_r2]MDV7188363.1 DUF4268 domain-containing protein [Lutibacter sp. TH_r2]
MFSKEESARLRKEFWTSYGKSFPRKWILYNTRIKDFSFKFVADTKKAMVVLDIESFDKTKNQLLFEQLLELKSNLLEDYLPDAIFDELYLLENGKFIHRVYVKYNGEFNIYNKDTWQGVYLFFNEAMHQFEEFFEDFEDFIRRAIF